MKYGWYSRTKPRVNVLRGFHGNESLGLTFSAAVTAGVTIKSGQVISLVAGKWVLGAGWDKTPYIAYSDSTDTDVISSGKLLGLSCSGDYEIETAYIATGTYNQDTPVKAAVGADVGSLTVAVHGDAIIGYCTRGGKRSVGPVVGTTFNKIANGGEQSQTSTAVDVIAFATKWTPKAATTTS